MCISVQEVRDTSVTGEFDEPKVAAAKISKQIDLVCPLYKSLMQKNVDGWRQLVALHAAHNIHVALKEEGADGDPGPVQSESFAQVGSRSYAVGNKDPGGGDWWMASPYGRTWRRYWIALPPAATAFAG